MPIDIILYAVIAAGLALWLKNILGTHHGDERSRPNIYAVDPASSASDESHEKNAALSVGDDKESHEIYDLFDNPEDVFAVDNREAAEGLIDIAQRDRGFEIRGFLKNAQDAFVFIVEAYAASDRETLKDLVTKSVLDAFEIGIRAREDNQEVQSTEIHAVNKVSVLEARLDRRQAFVTLKFEARETSVMKDRDGNILDGDPDKTTKMLDVWVFTRDLKSKDPRWFLCETRPVEDDNDLIPNSTDA